LSFPILALAALVAGCDDQFGPSDWVIVRDTVELYSLNRSDYQGLPAGFDFVTPRPVIIESINEARQWDVALTEGEGGLHFTPAGAFPNIDTRPAIAVLPDADFEELDKAPRDGDIYTSTESVTLETDRVYVVRTRNLPIIGQRCVRYAKVRPIAVDTEAGILRFEFIRNPNCNDRALVPPK